MAGKGGGAWKVAYADFVTAMMAFFMVMWLTSQKPDVKEAIAEYFREPTGYASGTEDDADPSNPHPESKGHRKKGTGYEKSNSRRAEGPASKKPLTLMMRNPIRTGVGISLPFGETATEVSPEAKELLRDFLPQVSGKPQKLEVRGHTTRRPMDPDSGFASPWELAYARCISTMKELEAMGVPPQRIRLSQAAGYEPLLDEASEEASARNPRVEVILLDEFSTE